VKRFRKQQRNVTETPPDTDTDTDTERDIYNLDFNKFWESYPKKTGKGYAYQCWKKIKTPKPTLEILIESIKLHTESNQWKDQSGKFIPNPSTWLNQRRWEDEIFKGGSEFGI
jgi:hypothetical protein